MKLRSLLQSLDLSAAWLRPYATTLRSLDAATDAVHDALNAARHPSVRVEFVPAAELPDDEAYEVFIARTARVPTRDNLHDLLNGLMWLTYPTTKQCLNQLQATAIASAGIGSTRGPLRDALTVFDENAAVLNAPTELIAALNRRDWNALFVEQRDAWQRTEVRLFGHALLEKLTRPRKAITAHVWIVNEVSDAAIAASLDVDRVASKAFLPLPVLGIPGWWDANRDPAFYADAQVFRAARSRTL